MFFNDKIYFYVEKTSNFMIPTLVLVKTVDFVYKIIHFQKLALGLSLFPAHFIDFLREVKDLLGCTAYCLRALYK